MGSVKWAMTVVVGKVIRLTGIQARFSKDWRWGVKWYHRFVYSIICTFGCNIVADGGKWPFIR